MCCLFGILNYSGKSDMELNTLINSLACEATIRGTDSTGIAYNKDGVLKIYKKPLSAYEMNFKGIENCISITGHTRYATQGSEKKNYNNHPFMAYCDNVKFALSHNGILYNDKQLRTVYNISKNKIDTDSYIAVQLLEHFGNLNFTNIGKMAEAVKGSFAFTMNDTEDNLYLVKGSSPLYLVHLPDEELYIYASTEEILFSAISHTDYLQHIIDGNFEMIPIKNGEILKIDKNGYITTDKFNYTDYTYNYDWYNINTITTTENDGYYYGFDDFDDYEDITGVIDEETLEELKTIASSMGIDKEYIEMLVEDGFSADEIEEYLYEEWQFSVKKAV